MPFRYSSSSPCLGTATYCRPPDWIHTTCHGCKQTAAGAFQPCSNQPPSYSSADEHRPRSLLFAQTVQESHADVPFVLSSRLSPIVCAGPASINFNMSFKFERDTYKQTEGGVAGVAGAAASAVADARDQLLGRDGPIPGTSGKHPIREAIGTAITGGKQNAGTKGYLAVCLALTSFSGQHLCEPIL